MPVPIVANLQNTCNDLVCNGVCACVCVCMSVILSQSCFKLNGELMHVAFSHSDLGARS